MITLRVLGGFALEGPPGAPVGRLSQQRAEAVLAVLAVAGDLGCTRDRLIGLLWPESDEARARHNLRDTLYLIRQSLGADAIVAGGTSLRLNSDIITTDVQILSSGLAATPVADALAWYRGPLLDGFHVDDAPGFAQWQDAERTKLARQYGESLERLATDAEVRGRPGEAAAWWARAVEHDPYNTRLVIRRMHALAASGDRANALMEADTHARRLRGELEIEPDAELAAEVVRIRNGNGIRTGAAQGPPAPVTPGQSRTPVPMGESDRAATTADVAPTVVAEAAPRRRGAGITVAVFAVAGTILLGAVLHVRGRGPVVVVGERRPLSREPGIEFFATISPDGGSVAYVAQTDTGWMVHVQDARGGRALPIGRGFAPLAWTADGSHVAVGAAVQSREAGGAEPVGPVLAPRMGGPVQRSAGGMLRSARAGRMLFQRGDSLFVGSGVGADETLAVVAPEITSAELAPDGRRVAWSQGNPHFASFAYLGNKAPSSIWVADVPGGPRVQVAGSTSLNVSPAWLPDGRHLVFISDRDGPRDLYVQAFDRRGRTHGEVERLTTGLDAATLSLSADGSRAAYTHSTVNRNIYTMPIPRTGPVGLSTARALTNGTQLIEMHALSPDGRWLAYQTDRSGNQDIWVIPVAGGEPRQLTRDHGDDLGPEFSPDGMEIAFYSTRHGSRDLFVIGFDGTGEARITTDPGEELLPDFSPDGLQLLFDAGPSMSERGIAMVARGETGAPWGAPAVVVPNALGARWAPDGSRFAFWRPGRGGMALAVRSLRGDERLLFDASRVRLMCFARIAWAPDSRSLYYTACEGRGWGVYRIATTGGVPELLVQSDDPARRIFADGFTVGNGRLYLTLGEFTSDIYVLDVKIR